jgi:hypothetical protein
MIHVVRQDTVVHLIALAHSQVWRAFVESGANDAASGDDANALTAALALVASKTQEGMTAKLSVIRDRLAGAKVLDLIQDTNGVDTKLVASYVDDALALVEA